MRAILLIAALLAGAAHAATPTVQQREPTAEERSSFDAFYHLHVPPEHSGGPSLFAPAFDVQRHKGEPWQVIARVDSSPRHMSMDLCRQIRTSYIYDAKAKKDERWTVSAAPPEWQVWLATPKVICTAARYTVKLDPAVNSVDAAAVLRQHKELLARARLLFAGNSQCARQRSLTFRLSAIEPAPPAKGAPQMIGLVFESDRDTIAKVAVRKSVNDYDAWNVSCP